MRAAGSLVQRRAFIGTVAESNYIAVTMATFDRLKGFDESFASPGGGAVNLDFFRRAAESGLDVVTLLGEGTFHQFHGGHTTNVPQSEHPWPAISAEYTKVTGRSYAVPSYNPFFIGALRSAGTRSSCAQCGVFSVQTNAVIEEEAATPLPDAAVAVSSGKCTKRGEDSISSAELADRIDHPIDLFAGRFPDRPRSRKYRASPCRLPRAFRRCDRFVRSYKADVRDCHRTRAACLSFSRSDV